MECDLVDKAKYPAFAHKNLLRLIFYQLEYIEYKRFKDCPNRTAQWLFLIQRNDIAGYEAFINKYPQSIYVKDARVYFDM